MVAPSYVYDWAFRQAWEDRERQVRLAFQTQTHMDQVRQRQLEWVRQEWLRQPRLLWPGDEGACTVQTCPCRTETQREGVV